MKRGLIGGIVFFLLLFSFTGCGKKPADGAPVSQGPEASKSAYEDVLTVSDIEGIAGIKELKMDTADSKLKFIGSDDAVVYEVTFRDEAFYEEEVGSNQEYYTDVPGIGDKAAIAIPDSPYRLVFTKGDRCVMTQTLAKNADGDWALSQEQLIDIAKMIASKLPD